MKHDIEQITAIVDSRNEFEEQDQKLSVEWCLSGNTQHLVGPTFSAALNKALLLHRRGSTELTASQWQV